MSNSIGWGKGADNNEIGWGQGAYNNTISWGIIDVFNIDGTGPFAITGSNSFIGDQIITGSITVSGSNISHVFPVISSSLSFVDDAAAAAGGVPLGGLYRSGNFILIRID
jgi:hypothetical protein